MAEILNNYPDNNPKTGAGFHKPPLFLVPPIADLYLSLAFADGAKKYGPYNWREKAITTSVYISAIKRHIDYWLDGEECAKDSGVNHLAHAMAGLVMILDSKDIGILNDDRPPKGAFAEQCEKATLQRMEAARTSQT